MNTLIKSKDVEITDLTVGSQIGVSDRWTRTGWSKVWYTIEEIHSRVSNPDFVADGRETPGYSIHAELKANRTGKPWRAVFHLYKGNLKGSLHKVSDWNERTAHWRHQEFLSVVKQAEAGQ